MKEFKAGTAETLTQVPVIVEVIGGVIECNPKKVLIYKDEQVEWIYHPSGLKIKFESERPFGQQEFDAGKQPRILSGPHDCVTFESFKYTVTVPVPGVEPLDPMVDADPRKRPPRK